MEGRRRCRARQCDTGPTNASQTSSLSQLPCSTRLSFTQHACLCQMKTCAFDIRNKLTITTKTNIIIIDFLSGHTVVTSEVLAAGRIIVQ